MYSTQKLKSTNKLGPFKKFLDVYGIKLVGLGNVGGQKSVSKNFLFKNAQLIQLLLNPLDPKINKNLQKKAILYLKENKTIQKIGYKSYDSYSPTLDSGKYKGWDKVNDNYSNVDFIWEYPSQKKSKDSTTAKSQITENLEHLLHTLTHFALPNIFQEQFVLYPKKKKSNFKKSLLNKAFEQAVKEKVFDISDYKHLDDGSQEYQRLLLTEYVYCLTFAEWGFIKEFTEDGSLDPEWSDKHLTKKEIKKSNPLGHKLFKSYISKVISKPSSEFLKQIFKNNGKGNSFYKPNSLKKIQEYGSSYNDKYIKKKSYDITFYGFEGNDKINTGKGNDKLFGGSGNDILIGGQGKNLLVGGKGKDIFKLSSGKGYDLIKDFEEKQDKIFIGSIKKLKLKNKGNDLYIYKGKDLLANVKGAKENLTKQGEYIV